MSILVDANTRVICQGITGTAGAFHTRACLDYGTQVVGGVSPGKGGRADANGLPIFDTVAEAVRYARPDATMIFVPARFAPAAIVEAADAGVRLIVVVTEGIPTLDMVRVRRHVAQRGARLIGPNCPGVISPPACKIGIMPGYIHRPGRVGVVSRSGTLTYEAVWQISQAGLGQSTSVGVGGDPIHGLGFVDVLAMFQADPETDAVVLIGEVGGDEEEQAASYIATRMTKPVVAFVTGQTALPGRRMGHAGAIISGGRGTADSKMVALRQAGATVVEKATEIGQAVRGLIPDA